MKISEALRGLVASIGIGLVAIGVALAPIAAPQALAQANAPALWKIDGPKGKVFLFGSFHLLPGDAKWRTRAFERALNEAKVVVFEADLAEQQDQQIMGALIAKYGLLPQGRTLSGVLPKKAHEQFERTATDLGVPPATLAPVRPWLAALTLGVHFVVRQGFDPSNGVDHQVMAWAQANGKALAALETNESQIRIFADLTPEEEAGLLTVTLGQIQEMPQLLDDMLAAYLKGDLATLDKILNAGFDEFPALRNRILKERHGKWLPQIEKMLADGRPHMIVVGAGHLVGSDSVIAMLRAKGVKVEGP